MNQNSNIENRPYYPKLYKDMIRDLYPHKESLCGNYLEKEHWTSLDVIQVNKLLFSSRKEKSDVRIDRKHRSYDEQSVRYILDYQRKNKLSNIEIANKYGLSRNTIAKWRRLFPEYCD